LKDDPKNNSTVYYGFQKIPNINEFMPQRLLQVMDSLHYLHYGNEPPKMEGSYKASDLRLIVVKKGPYSHWMMAPTPQLGNQFVKLFEQHIGIAKMQFWNEKGTPNIPQTHFVETSSTDSTFYYVTANPEHFTNDSLAPYYFQNYDFNKEDFNTVYIMGDSPYFTIFYYEIRHIFTTNFQPLNAVIISGKMDSETVIVNDTVNHKTDTIVQPVIKDYVMGIETMKYYKEGTSLNMILQAGGLATPGDVMIIRNDGVAVHGEIDN
jgi:hypothetical protein